MDIVSTARFHRISALIWLALLVPAILFWSHSVLFVIIASVYANVKSDWGAASAADNTEVVSRIDDLEGSLPGIPPAKLQPASDGPPQDFDG